MKITETISIALALAATPAMISSCKGGTTDDQDVIHDDFPATEYKAVDLGMDETHQAIASWIRLGP